VADRADGITTIGLGTWAIGGRQWGPQDDEASIGAIHAAIDHGDNWIDTAPIYGSGHSEEVVGRALNLCFLTPATARRRSTRVQSGSTDFAKAWLSRELNR